MTLLAPVRSPAGAEPVVGRRFRESIPRTHPGQGPCGLPDPAGVTIANAGIPGGVKGPG